MAAYWQDFSIGDEIVTAEGSVDRDGMVSFAAQWDPQPMHLSEEGGAASPFGALVGSGWQALCLSMRLMVEARPFDGAPLLGVELDRIRLKRPLLPGMRLKVRARVLETRPSSKPGRGYVRLALATLILPGEDELLTQEWTMLVPGRT